MLLLFFFFFKQKTAYEMRISDWSSDVCSSDLPIAGRPMLLHLMASVDELDPAKKVVIVGDKADQLEAALGGSAELAVQDPQLGTGHAVQQGEGALAGFAKENEGGQVLILYGDVPFELGRASCGDRGCQYG